MAGTRGLRLVDSAVVCRHGGTYDKAAGCRALLDMLSEMQNSLYDILLKDEKPGLEDEYCLSCPFESGWTKLNLASFNVRLKITTHGSYENNAETANAPGQGQSPTNSSQTAVK